MDNLLDDVKIYLFSYFEYKDIFIISQINKSWHQLCQDNRLWNNLIKRDFKFCLNNLLDAKEKYLLFYRCFDEYTMKIIARFIVLKTKFVNLQQVYQRIFITLIDYVTEYHLIVKIDEYPSQSECGLKMQVILVYNIFDIMSLPCNLSSINDNNDVRRARELLAIISDMMLDYGDDLRC